jgi:hypothetical protein
MDPYLEDRWRDVHASLILYTRDQLQPQVMPRYRSRVEERVVLDTPAAPAYAPDVKIVLPRSNWGTDRPPAGSGGVAVMESTVAEPEVMVFPQAETFTETFIQIIDPKDNGRVVTVIEFLSPTNKREGADMDAYRKKQQELIASDIAFVEIDLLRGGKREMHVPSYRSTRLRMHYAAVVSRPEKYRKAEVYGFDLRQRLPSIRIPLRAPDADVLLDLQKVIDLAYVNGGYDITDYSKPPEPPLEGDDAGWATGLFSANRPAST